MAAQQAEAAAAMAGRGTAHTGHANEEHTQRSARLTPALRPSYCLTFGALVLDANAVRQRTRHECRESPT